MHVSGFNQNVLVGDSLLSISIDKYLGEEYPLYQEFFYDFQSRLMTPGHIAPQLSGRLADVRISVRRKRKRTIGPHDL
ncbi:MAG: hypothetical protein LUH63_05295 [Parabacteroides sp.]|nr:hypothetical protein [Parabacteroides sp.]